MIKTLSAAAAALGLAACASTSREISRPAQTAVAVSPGETASSAPDDARTFIDGALSMLGQPYRYGGAAPGGFDCSGLVFYSAATAGIRLPRTAADQLHFGTAVARSKLRAGDLVFMHLSGKELHVAIALDSQLFIHAPSSGGYVRIDSLIASPYANGFIGARRILAPGVSTVSSPIPN